MIYHAQNALLASEEQDGLNKKLVEGDFILTFSSLIRYYKILNPTVDLTTELSRMIYLKRHLVAIL